MSSGQVFPDAVAISASDARDLTDKIKIGFANLPAMYAELDRLRIIIRGAQARPVDDRPVYFLLAWRSRLIKIGVSSDPVARMRSIQMMSPEPLELIAATRGGGAELESRLHTMLAPLRSHGEWFHATSELLEILIEVNS